MTALEAAYQLYAKHDLVVIGVGSMDGERPLTGFVLSTGVTFPVVWDGLGDVSSAFGIRGIPTTHFIDRAGKVQATVTGSLDLEQLEARIRTIMD
jgi:peroxiredoxin